MAHQAHNLPRQTLAFNFKISIAYTIRASEAKPTSFLAIKKINSKNYCISSMPLHTVENFTTTERTKWASDYTVPEAEEVIISFSIAQNQKTNTRGPPRTGFQGEIPVLLQPKCTRMSFSSKRHYMLVPMVPMNKSSTFLPSDSSNFVFSTIK
ncbi:hypothetical protein EJ08DRAFT_663658 [Tothia fuscella]|uniref:Uncharacterized protein n=1 Tax=Tothia fuscella TaxID=1048955 RepID=A0A9P4NK60_9PEZI|nr:hypothetical protein EJ08DRAFT_663658 [Tothia fuscella]